MGLGSERGDRAEVRGECCAGGQDALGDEGAGCLRSPPDPFPPRSRTMRSGFSKRPIRNPVNVSAYTGSALNAPPVQAKCPLRRLLHPFNAHQATLALTRESKIPGPVSYAE